LTATNGWPAVTRYRWSPLRSLMVIAALVSLAVASPEPTGMASAAFSPLTRGDVMKIVRMHHPRPELVRAIIQVESRWNPRARSSAGAVGLMQVKPASARMVGLDYRAADLLCPEKNIRAGTRILRHYQRTSGSLREALRLYSGGARNYYERVMREMARGDDGSMACRATGLTGRCKPETRSLPATQLAPAGEEVRGFAQRQ